MSVVLAILICLLILFSELKRIKKVLYVDFLRAASISFLIIYGIAPLIIHTLGLPSSPRFFWMHLIPYNDPWLSVPALLIAIIAYISIRLGWIISRGARFILAFAQNVGENLKRVSDSLWLLVAIILLFVAILSLFLYSARREADILTLIQYAGALRIYQPVPGVSEVSFTFLTYSMQGITATFILLGLARRIKKSGIYVMILFFSSALSLATLLMRAGRLHLMNFGIVIAVIVFQNKSLLSRFIGIIIGITAISVIPIAGKYLLGIAQNWNMPANLGEFLTLMAAEAGFPYLSLINTISSLTSYRLFLDIPLAIIYMVGVPLYRVFAGIPPQDLPLSVAKVNTVSIIGTIGQGEIPVDLVTLGYFNAGVMGVIITAVFYGLLIGWMDLAFRAGRNSVIYTLRIAWIVFMATVGLIYADPVNVFRDGLYLILPTSIVIMLTLLAPRSLNTNRSPKK
jgi:hypothetical protein